jgi:ankyrin repeat protein
MKKLMLFPDIKFNLFLPGFLKCLKTSKKLLDEPPLTRGRDKSGRTPLYYATSANNYEVVEMLLDLDKTSAYLADTSSQLFPVHVAAKLGNLEVLKKLFEQCPGSDELLNREGKNFLHLAVEEKRSDVVKWVCKNSKLEKALNTPDIHGNTPLHLAVEARDQTSVLHLILRKGVVLNWVNKEELTPLDIASFQRKDAFSDLQVYRLYRPY